MSKSTSIRKKFVGASVSMLLLSTLFISSQVWAQSSGDSTEVLFSEFQSLLSELEALQNISDQAVVVDGLNQKITALHVKVKSLVQDGELKPNLLSYLNAALIKVNDATSFVHALDETEANNMINAADNIINAFISNVEAEKDKKIPSDLANELIADARVISNDSLRRGIDTAEIIVSTPLISTGQIIDRAKDDVGSLREIVAILESRGFTVTVSTQRFSPTQGIISFFNSATSEAFDVIIPHLTLPMLATIGIFDEVLLAGVQLSNEQVALLLVSNPVLTEAVTTLENADLASTFVFCLSRVPILDPRVRLGFCIGTIIGVIAENPEIQEIIIHLIIDKAPELGEMVYDTILPQIRTISGFKFNDTNANSQKDDGELPLKDFGFRISAVGFSFDVTIDFMQTGVDGTFSFENKRVPIGTSEIILAEELSSTLIAQGWSPTSDPIRRIPFEPNLVRTDIAFGNRQIGCVPAPSGLVSWWSGDGNANDIQDSNHGILVNGATFTTGMVGQAFSFDGAGGVLTTANTNFNSPKQLTIDAWIKPTQLSTANDIHIIVNKETGTVAGSIQYEIGVSSGLGQIPAGNLAIFIGGISAAEGIVGGLPNHGSGWTDGGGPVPLNQFTHVALIVNLDTGTVRTYINGEVAKQYIVPSGLSVTIVPAAPLRIGFRSLAAPAGNFIGAIDEVEIFNRALTESEIQAIFNAGSAGKCKEGLGCISPPPNMISWWPGDGNANDIQDSNHGTLVNGATFTTGKVGQAFSFDGADDFVLAADSDSLDFTTGGITLDAWIRIDEPVSFSSIIYKGHDASVADRTGNYGLDLGLSGTNPRFGFLDNNNAFHTFALSGSISTGMFHHVAFTYTYGSGSTAQVWIDGVNSAGSWTFGSGNVLGIANTDPLFIGKTNSPGSGIFFKGLIDEVEIYNRALTQSEIEAIFNAGSAGKCKPVQTCTPPPSNLVSWWPGDGNANDIQDSNHGTLVNGATFGLGKVGQAFTNLNAPVDYVRIPHAANIDLMNSAHTLDNWIFVTTFDSEWAPLTPVKLGGFGGLWYNNLGHFLRAHVWVNPTEVRFLDAPFIFPTDQWIHVAQVYEQSTTTLSIYVNGALVGSGAGSVVPNDFGINHPILIGRGWSETGPSVSAQYSSSFDEVEIYNRALSESEIQAIFNAGSAGKCKFIIDTENRVIENSKLRIKWDLNNPEQINEIFFKEFDPNRNLVNVFLLSPDSAFDDEFTGNSWAPPDPHAGGIVLVGRGQSPNQWIAGIDPSSSAIKVEINSIGIFGVPVKTTYTLNADSSAILIDRTFQFSVKPLDRDFRPYIFRSFSYTDFSTVVYTNNLGTLSMENVSNCPGGCEKFNWDDVLADIESPNLNIGVALRNSQSNPSSTLWIDFDGFSQTSYVSALVKKPSLFNFNTDIFVSYSYCLHTGGIEVAEQVC